MDTHINPDPEFERRKAPLEVSLPDDPRTEADHDGPPEDGARSVVPPIAGERLAAASEKPRRRHRLLAGGAVTVIVGIGAVAFLVSPYNTYVPATGLKSAINSVAADAGMRWPLLAPSATLAHVAAPPLPPPVERDKYRAPPRGSEMQEVLALKEGARSPAPVPAAPPSDTPASDGPPPGYVPHEPGAAVIVSAPTASRATPAPQPYPGPSPRSGQSDVTAAVVAGMRHERPRTSQPGAPGTQSGPQLTEAPTAPEAAAPSSPSPVRPPETPVAPAPFPVAPEVVAGVAADPVSALKGVQAAPMSSPQQIQVLELVTRLATVVGDQRREVDQLRSDLSRTRADDQSRLDDFQRRLALAEAARAVTAASDPTAAPAEQTIRAPSPAVVRPSLVPARTAVPADDAVRRYRVQAASPGLAMLAQVDRAGDEGAQLQVALGDEVPG